jgi:hypothetical protein
MVQVQSPVPKTTTTKKKIKEGKETLKKADGILKYKSVPLKHNVQGKPAICELYV